MMQFLSNYSRMWCQSSACCDDYILADATTKFPDGTPVDSTIPALWRKVEVVRQVLLLRRTTVVYLDVDALILSRSWCPAFETAGQQMGMLIAPDPIPYHAPTNTGWFAFSPDRLGWRLANAWWDAYMYNVSACWKPVHGICDKCRSSRSACTKHTRKCCPCHNGGRCDDQGAFNEHVLPPFRQHIRLMPKHFQHLTAFPSRYLGDDATLQKILESPRCSRIAQVEHFTTTTFPRWAVETRHISNTSVLLGCVRA